MKGTENPYVRWFKHMFEQMQQQEFHEHGK